jgi:hypothetical protein
MSEKEESEKDIKDAELEHQEDRDFWHYRCNDCGNMNDQCVCGGYN